MLLDTGAGLSLIKMGKLNQDLQVHTDTITELKGISNTPTLTLGTLPLNIEITQGKSLKHTFHIVPDNFPITQDGILGEDLFRKFNAILNYKDNTFTYHFKENGYTTDFIYKRNSITIPDRSEKVIKYGPIHEHSKQIYFPKEILPQVFTSLAILSLNQRTVLYTYLY